MAPASESFTRLIDEILSRHDTSHDFGRREAYEAAIEYARSNLMSDPRRDEFVREAADRLGFVPAPLDKIVSRRRLSQGTWLDVWISDLDDEVAITGTRAGLQYLIDLLTRLRDSEEQGEHFHLDRGSVPMTDVSANLVIFREDEEWFTEEGSPVEPLPRRDVEPEAIHALQVLHYPPEDVPLNVGALYRVTGVEKGEIADEGVKEVPGEKESDRYYRFTVVAEGGEKVTLTFHLDDPGLNFFTHREIMALALKTVD